MVVYCHPGEKESVSMWYICGFHANFRAYYHAVLPQTIHFGCDGKPKLERSASILCAFGPSAIKLQCPRVSHAISLL